MRDLEGPPGEKGDGGENHNPGDRGRGGVQGDEGLPGGKGDIGVRNVGIPGMKGLPGEQGLTGPRGPPGPMGSSGINQRPVSAYNIQRTSKRIFLGCVIPPLFAWESLRNLRKTKNLFEGLCTPLSSYLCFILLFPSHN